MLVEYCPQHTPKMLQLHAMGRLFGATKVPETNMQWLAMIQDVADRAEQARVPTTEYHFLWLV